MAAGAVWASTEPNLTCAHVEQSIIQEISLLNKQSLPPRRVALYARYSTDMQNPKSVDDQFRECRKYADKQGWSVVAEFSDSGLSGSLRDRPGYNDLVAALPAGQFDIVLVEHIERVARDLERSAKFYKATMFAGIELHQLNRGKLGLLDIGILSTFAEIFLEELGHKTRRGLVGRIEAGASGGGLSYGYRVPRTETGQPIKGELVIVPEEAEVIRRIFRDYAAGKSPLHIAAELNKAGIPAPRGRGEGTGHWKQNTINGNRQRGTGILNNELYAGLRVWNRQKFSKHPETGRRIARMNPESEWMLKAVPTLRIVDEGMWEAVKRRQDAMGKVRVTREATDRNGLSVAQSMRRRKYLLSGLLTCGQCGGKMTVAGTGERKRYYCANAKEKGPAVCGGMPGLKEVDAAESILSGLKTGLMQDEAYEAFRARFTALVSEQEASLGAVQKQQEDRIRETAKVQANLLRAVEAGQISDSILERLREVDAELATLRAAQAAQAPAQVTLPDDLPALYRAYVEDLVATLTDGDVAGRAGDELQELLESVVVSWDADLGAHWLDLRGKLLEMLQKAKPAEGAGFVSCEVSLKLVAGVGFEPTTFRL
jgi:site-specific DNA recombinase